MGEVVLRLLTRIAVLRNSFFDRFLLIFERRIVFDPLFFVD